MEKKNKTVNKNNSKIKKSERTTKKRVKKTRKRGFTLIELLAVIIILGILMVIAIPSVTTYISNSRKNAYVNTAKEIIGAARNLVNSGKLEVYDADTTYYISTDCISTENNAESPYGKFTKAYVVVVYNGNGFNYYWISLDESGQGIKKLTSVDALSVDSIESDLKDEDIADYYGIDGRNKYMIIDKQNTNCQIGETNDVDGIIISATGELDPHSIKYVCEPGTYLAKASETCTNCPQGKYCPGGKYPYNATDDQGATICVNGSYSPANSSSCIACTDGKTSYYSQYYSYCNSTCPNSFGTSSWKSASWSPNEVNNLCTINSCQNVSNGSFTLSNNVCVFNGTLYINTNNSKQFKVGTDISTLYLNNTTAYFSPNELGNFTRHMNIKATVSNNIITSYELCFRINGNGIYVSGGRSGDYCFRIPFNNNTTETYRYNVNVLKTVFGSNNSRCTESSTSYKCARNSSYYGYTFEVFKNGKITIYHDDDDYEANNGFYGNPYCIVDVNKVASCPGSSCLSIDTEVEVYDKKKKKRLRKKIKDLTYDDLVLVWDFDKAEFTWAKPLWIRKIDTAKSYHLVKFSDGSELKVIGEHKIFNADTNKFVSLIKSNVGFNTLNSKGELVKVISRKLINEKIEFTSVVTNKHMNLFTNDVLTSITFNNLYKIKDRKYVKDVVSNNSREMYEGISKKYYDGFRLKEMGMKFSTVDVIDTINGMDKVKK